MHCKDRSLVPFAVQLDLTSMSGNNAMRQKKPYAETLN